MRHAMIVPMLLLSACATTEQQASADLDDSLDAMIGQPVSVALARLGEPIAAVPTGSELVYGWGYGFTRAEFTNAAPGWVDAAASQGGIFATPRRTARDSCVIRMVVGADGLIRNWDYQGNERDCRAYADRLVGHAVARAD